MESTSPPENVKRFDYCDSGKLNCCQAIVLAAGCGSKLAINFGTTKCLLPVANIPMLYYPLHKLETTGFTDCELVIPEEFEAQVTDMISKYNLKIKPNLHTINLDDGFGTLDSVRKAATSLRKSTRYVIIMSSDLITNVDIEKIYTTTLSYGNALTMLISPYLEDRMIKSPGAKEVKPEGAEDDLDMLELIKDKPIVSRSIIGGDEKEESTKFPRVEPSDDILVTVENIDQHLYMFHRAVLTDYILAKSSPCRKMTSLKNEVVPHLIDMQFVPITNCKPVYLKATQRRNDYYTGILNSPEENNPLHPLSKYIRTVVYYCDRKELSLRANNRISYWHLNCKVPEVLGSERVAKGCLFGLDTKQPNVTIAPTATIEGRTLLGAGVTVGADSVVLDSNVGARVCLGSGCKVSRCVLMPGITVADGCILEDSLISCDIKAKNVEIIKSIVANSDTFNQGQRYDGETFDSFLRE